ncbi:MAG: Crp/Fnr family transcriptional regulator [Acidobacteriota bacterium]
MMDDIFFKLEGTRGTHPAQASKINTYRAGDVILRQGDYCSHYFVIMSGQVRIDYKGKKARMLDEQDVFGLENVLFKKPSPYSATALTKARIADYSPEALDHLINESPRMVRTVLISTLQQLLQTTRNLWSDTEMFAIDPVRVNFYKPGETIIREGSIGTDFYRLVSSQGGLLVTLNGKEISRIEKPGEFFGEMAGLLSSTRQTTVTSLGESVVEVYSKDDLEVIIKDYPEVALEIMRTLVTRLAEADHKIA